MTTNHCFCYPPMFSDGCCTIIIILSSIFGRLLFYFHVSCCRAKCPGCLTFHWGRRTRIDTQTSFQVNQNSAPFHSHIQTLSFTHAFFFGLFHIWGRRFEFSISTFSGLVLLLSLLVYLSCLFLKQEQELY